MEGYDSHDHSFHRLWWQKLRYIINPKFYIVFVYVCVTIYYLHFRLHDIDIMHIVLLRIYDLATSLDFVPSKTHTHVHTCPPKRVCLGNIFH